MGISYLECNPEQTTNCCVCGTEFIRNYGSEMLI